jgi:hypothetical protein
MFFILKIVKVSYGVRIYWIFMEDITLKYWETHILTAIESYTRLVRKHCWTLDSLRRSKTIYCCSILHVHTTCAHICASVYIVSCPTVYACSSACRPKAYVCGSVYLLRRFAVQFTLIIGIQLMSLVQFTSAKTSPTA